MVLIAHPTTQIFDTAVEAADAVARLVIDAVCARPTIVLGLATGASMVPVYAALRQASNDGVDFSRITTFNLDEYLSDQPVYRTEMQERFFGPANVTRVHFPVAEEPYDALIARHGGIDLQILGIGRNGHIAFNEPGAARDSVTRVVTLDDDTLAANAPNFVGRAQPKQAVTMGISSILAAREIVVLATGAAKKAAVRQALHGPQTTDCPASFLQDHPSVRWFLDRDSA